VSVKLARQKIFKEKHWRRILMKEVKSKGKTNTLAFSVFENFD